MTQHGEMEEKACRVLWPRKAPCGLITPRPQDIGLPSRETIKQIFPGKRSGIEAPWQPLVQWIGGECRSAPEGSPRSPPPSSGCPLFLLCRLEGVPFSSAQGTDPPQRTQHPCPDCCCSCTENRLHSQEGRESYQTRHLQARSSCRDERFLLWGVGMAASFPGPLSQRVRVTRSAFLPHHLRKWDPILFSISEVQMT